MPLVTRVESSSSSSDSEPERHHRHRHHSKRRSSSRDRRPKPAHRQRSNFVVQPDPFGLNHFNNETLHRARSVGHGPAPELHFHMDQHQRTDGLSPAAAEAPRGRHKKKHRPQSSDDEAVVVPDMPGVPMAPGAGGLPGFPMPVTGHGHGHGKHGSRDVSPYWHEAKYQQMLQKEEAEEREQEKARAIADHIREEEERKKEHKAMLEKWESDQRAKKKEEEEEEKRIVERYEQKQKEKKEKEKKEWEEFELKQKLKKEEEAAKKKKEEEEYKERLYKDFSKFGFSNNQIEHMINHDEKKKSEETTLTRRTSKHHSSSHRREKSGSLVGRPVYPKIRRDDIDMETLKYYDLPWEYEYGSNDEFIIILQEMNVKDTDTLFEHTRRLRSRKTLTIRETGAKDKPEYAWVRRRSRSKSVGKDRGKSPRRESVAETILKGR